MPNDYDLQQSHLDAIFQKLNEICSGNFPPIGTIENLQKESLQSGLKFYIADEPVRVNITVNRAMYDDAPDLASYTTHHVGEIQKGDVFIAQNRYVHECPDMNMGLNGIGEELSRDIYVNLAAEKAMREITLSEYLVRHIARNIKSLNQSKVSPEKLENIAKYEKILTLEVNTPEVEQYIRSKAPTDNLDMHDYLAQLVEAPKKYPDCPSCVKEASTLLQGDGMLDSYLMWRFNTYPESTHLLSVSAANAHNKEINEKVAKMCVTLAQLADPTIELVQPKQPPMGEPLTP